MKKTTILLSAIIVIIGFYACSHPPFAPATHATHDTLNANTTVVIPPDTTHTPEPVDTSVCFQRDILPIFLGSCAMSGCHSAASRKDGYTLTTYATITAKGLVKGNAASSKLYTVCKNNSMPQNPIAKLDSTQLSLLKRWINNGANNDTNCAVNCDTTKYTYSGAIAPMMKTYCTSCHATASAASAGGGIILDTYAAILVQAQNGKLLGDISHNTGFNYMPLGGAKLSDCKITQVSKWIAAGAPNN